LIFRTSGPSLSYRISWASWWFKIIWKQGKPLAAIQKTDKLKNDVIVFQGWMIDKRIFGNGVVFCGVPLGGLILSPFWTYLFGDFTWRGTCILQAGIALQNLWICLLIIECPLAPIDTGRKPIGEFKIVCRGSFGKKLKFWSQIENLGKIWEILR